ncbi:MAG: hypothetical protein SGARI_002747 [Bacillariaceae sp.]
MKLWWTLATVALPVILSAVIAFYVKLPWFCTGTCCIFETSCSAQTLQGTVDPAYKRVAALYESLLTNGWDVGGFLFVAVNGNVVLDVYGGHADKERTHPITKDSQTLMFSSGKVLETMAVAVAVDKGLLRLDDAISQHWPEFAAHGKDREPTLETLQDNSKRDAFLANQKPFRPPGYVMYRALASALYTDAIIRRVDPAGRSLSDFVQQEIMDKIDDGKLICPPIVFNDDTNLVPVQEASMATILLGMVAQVFFPSAWRKLLGERHMLAMNPDEVQTLYNFITKNGDILGNTLSIPGIANGGAASFNNETSFLSYPMMSANCFSNAHSIGMAMDAFFYSGSNIVGPETLQTFTAPLPTAYDNLLFANMTHTAGGFAIGSNILLPYNDDNSNGSGTCVGWGGTGGSALQHCQVGNDDDRVTFAYIPVGLSPRLALERAVLLLEETLDTVQSINES